MVLLISYFLVLVVVAGHPLKHLSKSHHILSIEDDVGCPCADKPSRRCPCGTPPPPPLPVGGGRHNFRRTLNDDGDDLLSEGDFDNYYGYTANGTAIDSQPEVNMTDIFPDGIPTLTTPPVVVIPSVQSTDNATITNSVTARSSSSPPITDQRLLTLYRGHDASDRSANSEYEDVVTDFHAGWSVWPFNVVQFQFDPDVSTCAKSVFNVAAGVISDNTCVQFLEITKSPAVETAASSPVLRVTDSPDTGCFASLGYSALGNVLNLGSGCINTGTGIHLLLHVLGLFHEHQRPDRDTYVQVNSGFVDTLRTGGSTGSDKFNAVFGKAADNMLNTVWVNATLARPYDYGSIMHNGPCHYSVTEEYGGGPSACAINPTLVVAGVSSQAAAGIAFMGNASMVGNRATMSLGDAILVGKLYNCPIDSIKEADPLDAVNTDMAVCTAVDANNFKWTQTAAAANAATAVSSSVLTTASTTATTTASPNELASFKDFFRNSSRQTRILMYSAAGGLVLVIVTVAFLIYWKKKKQNRRGRRALALNTDDPHDPIAPLIRDSHYGDSTDSEALAEILGDDDLSPVAQAPIAPQATASSSASKPVIPA